MRIRSDRKTLSEPGLAERFHAWLEADARADVAAEREFRRHFDRAHQLSPRESEELDRVLASIGRGQHLGRLLTRWQNFVQEVEEGYDGDFSDYTNDLQIRCLLEAVVMSIGESTRIKLRSIVDPWDGRFLVSTHVNPDNLILDLDGDELQEKGVDPWWSIRIPTKMTPRLSQGMLDMGW